MATIYKSNQSEACRQFRTSASLYLRALATAIAVAKGGAGLTTEDQVIAAGEGQTVVQAHFVGMTTREQTVYNPSNERFQADMQAVIDAGPIVP